MSETPETPARNPYKIRGPETWALVQEQYLAGAPARLLAERYDVTTHAIYPRASRKGWTKGQRRPPAALTPAAAPPWADVRAAAAPEPAALAEECLAGAAAALRAGRLAEAEGLARLAKSFGALAPPAPPARTTAAGEPPADVRRLEQEHAMTLRVRDHAEAALDGLAVAAFPVEPASLMQTALVEAALALQRGDAGEARTLSQMAESLSRTAQRAPQTSLEAVLRALRDPGYRAELFRIDPDRADDPDLAVKRAYWGRG